MTKRFDRERAAKHHLQTLCAMAHLDYKQRGSHDYSQLFLTIQALALGDSALEQAFRRMAFNAIAANFDDHTKNHSFLLRNAADWSLAPAYDVTHSYNPVGEWTFQHLMSIDGKFSNITRRDLLAVGDRFLVPGAKHIVDEVIGSVSHWPRFAAAAGLPRGDSERIAADHAAVFARK